MKRDSKDYMGTPGSAQATPQRGRKTQSQFDFPSSIGTISDVIAEIGDGGKVHDVFQRFLKPEHVWGDGSQSAANAFLDRNASVSKQCAFLAKYADEGWRDWKPSRVGVYFASLASKFGTKFPVEAADVLAAVEGVVHTQPLIESHVAAGSKVTVAYNSKVDLYQVQIHLAKCTADDLALVVVTANGHKLVLAETRQTVDDTVAIFSPCSQISGHCLLVDISMPSLKLEEMPEVLANTVIEAKANQVMLEVLDMHRILGKDGSDGILSAQDVADVFQDLAMGFFSSNKVPQGTTRCAMGMVWAIKGNHFTMDYNGWAYAPRPASLSEFAQLACASAAIKVHRYYPAQSPCAQVLPSTVEGPRFLIPTGPRSGWNSSASRTSLAQWAQQRDYAGQLFHEARQAWAHPAVGYNATM